MMREWHCQLDVTLQLLPIDPILIKSGYATLDGPDMVPVRSVKNGEESWILPGSSLKGALRSHFERISRSLKPHSVCLPYLDPKRADIPVPVESDRPHVISCGYRDDDKAERSLFYRNACAACRLFGSLRYAGRFSIGDAYPEPDQKPKSVQRNGVGIDRYTGGTVKGVLFDLTALEGGVFTTQLRVTNFELWQLAAVYFLLLDLEEEQISIGSGRSRGMGRVKGTVREFKLSYLKPQGVLAGLAALVREEERRAYGLFQPSPLPAVPLPEGRRKGLRHEYLVAQDWATRLEPLCGMLEGFLNFQPGPRGKVLRGGAAYA